MKAWRQPGARLTWPRTAVRRATGWEPSAVRMCYIVYVSAASTEMSDAQLVRILETSRALNQASGITGMLLHMGGSFMQLLEGPEDSLAETYARIRADPRHHGIQTLREGDLAARSFSDWSMGFRTVKADELRGVPGFESLDDGVRFVSPEVTDKPQIAVRLLETFHRTMR